MTDTTKQVPDCTRCCCPAALMVGVRAEVPAGSWRLEPMCPKCAMENIVEGPKKRPPARAG